MRGDRHRLAGLGCVVCGSGRAVALCGVAPGWCAACRRELRPTRVDSALAAAELTQAGAAELARVSARTVRRAALGVAIGAESARRLGAALGIDGRALVRPGGGR